MNLLLLLYAMIAGLAGINAGPAATSRMAAVAQGGALAGDVHLAPTQVQIAAHALNIAVQAVRVVPALASIDARRIAATATPQLLPVTGRAAPERRLE